MNPQVLVVDDSATVRMDLRITLGALGMTVTACETKALAQKIIRSRTFALVILDVILPDGDGIDLLRELRAAPAYMRVPIIMLSTEADVRSRLQGLDAGADEYVGKPYDIEHLARRARELIDQRGAAAGQPDSSRGKRLLIVDDSPTYLDAIGTVLKQDGYDVVTVTSGEDALRQLAIRRVDGIILDLVMPGIGGMETARRIKRDPALRGIPIMIVTGRDDRRTRDEGQDIGVDDFVLKSPELSLLKVRVRGLWRKLREGRAEETPPSSGVVADPAPSSGVLVEPPPSSGSGAAADSGDAPAGSLFEQVIALSGLSSVIGPSTLARACRRAGVRARTMTPADLARAMPAIRETLRVFLPPEDLDRCTEAIAALAEATGTGS
jgi:DNA-binding response OmpR family regulator